MSQRYREKPTSLKEGAAASDRRILAQEDSTTADPTLPSHGQATRNSRYLHIVARCGDAADSATLRLWLWDSASETWTKETTSVVLAGVVAERRRIEIGGADRVYLQVEVVNVQGGSGIDAWLAGSTFG